MMFSKRRNALAARAVVASIALSGARALCTSPCYLLYAMSLCFEHSIDWSARGAWHRRNVRDPGLQIPPSHNNNFLTGGPRRAGGAVLPQRGAEDEGRRGDGAAGHGRAGGGGNGRGENG